MCMSTHSHSHLSQTLTYQHLDLPKDELLESVGSHYNNHFQQTDFYAHIMSDWGNTDCELFKSAGFRGKFRIAFQLGFGVLQHLGRAQAMACSGYHTGMMCSAPDSSTTAPCPGQLIQPGFQAFPRLRELLKIHFSRDLFFLKLFLGQ